MLIKLILFLSLFSVCLSAQLRSRFGAFEHRMAGDDIALEGAGRKLTLPNGLSLSFGEIIAMGDFYGIYGSSISGGSSHAEKIERFIAVFSTLAEKTDAVDEVTKIVDSLYQDEKNVLSGIERGHLPQDVYDLAGKERVRNWNCITGGGCSGPVWWLNPGRFMWLAKDNFDHFGSDAIMAYRIGHEAALREAANQHLELAYAIEALACHYLTDRFASGHIRVPRRTLSENVRPRTIGDMLSGFMHNEEGQLGLHVHNQRGDRWVAWGDGRYLDAQNDENRAMTREALERSVKEVYQAFETHHVQLDFSALELIPWADESGNIEPMFYFDADADRMMRRVDLSDPRDAHWTSHWWGWSTLVELKRIKGLPSDAGPPEAAAPAL